MVTYIKLIKVSWNIINEKNTPKLLGNYDFLMFISLTSKWSYKHPVAKLTQHIS